MTGQRGWDGGMIEALPRLRGKEQPKCQGENEVNGSRPVETVLLWSFGVPRPGGSKPPPAHRRCIFRSVMRLRAQLQFHSFREEPPVWP